MSLLGRIRGVLSRPRKIEVRPIRGRYDAATDLNETKNIWSAADTLDADAANSLDVRIKLRKRSRYERQNNGHNAGVIRTQANYVIGTGPRLRMQTGSPGTNAMVEAAWQRWTQAVRLNRKLRILCRAKVGDGEAFAQISTNPMLADVVQLDITPIECDQVTAPISAPYNDPQYVDGIRFDEYGNVVSYDVLTRHPGSSWFNTISEYSTISARYMVHWFGGDERPGQHRGIPELTPTLNLFATGRRFREAVVAAAETAADFSAMLQIPAGNDGPDEVAPFTTLPIEKRMFIASPAGAEIKQMAAEQPSTTYETFNRQMISEEARPLSMSYSLAACDSSGNSFSGTQNDHLVYYRSCTVERDECVSSVIDPIFALWFEEAARAYQWTFARTPAPKHSWDWDEMPKIDNQKTASARKIALGCGATSLGKVYSEDGLDFEDEVQAMAVEYGVPLEDMRQRLLDANLPVGGGKQQQQQQQEQPEPDEDQQDEERETRASFNRGGNGNGQHPIMEQLW